MEQSLFKEILKARVYDVARHTVLEAAPQLSTAWGNSIYIKREDLQPIFSFKIRGAYNRIAAIPKDERSRGVICASAGNHGQGVALSARRLGMPAWVVMPTTTPDIKIKAVARFGAEIVLAGDHYSQAYDHCLQLVEKLGAQMIHPFDDPLVIAGQGTVGKEIIEDCPEVDYVFVPVGGGGLLAGLAIYIKSLNPAVKIYGVEPLDSDAMARSVQQNERVVLDQVGVFADGVAVRQVGSHTLAIAQNHVDGFIQVSTDEICSAIQDIYSETRTIVEPAGALSWAGAKAFIRQHALKEKHIVTINSGANMNFQRLQFVAERAMTGAGRECLLAIRLLERPGALKEFCTQILAGKAITEFNYRTNGTPEAYIFLGLSVHGIDDQERLLIRLRDEGYRVEDLTENELAKEHVRHMVGGRAPQAIEEELYSFVFPERPRALADFLAVISDRWNISLFHYRSHGADYGRVLIAFEVRRDERLDFEGHLQRINYPFTRETDNPAYRLLL
ncbi:MAG: threonine ammonia-lyase, biosynthetic [Pseudobdellovibrionaceae bacterium]|nr:threonine ammonia-lyase, biosynthetic [Pseudobdellovibrionaceae bacterium]